MADDLSTDLYASQMGIFGVSIGILRALVARGVLHPAEAAGIVREAATLLPPSDGGWKSVQRQTYATAAELLDDPEAIAAAA